MWPYRSRAIAGIAAAGIGLILAVLGGTAGWLRYEHEKANPVPAPAALAKAVPITEARPAGAARTSSAVMAASPERRLVAPILAAYDRGDYRVARAAAQQVIRSVQAAPHPAIGERKAAAQARHLIAFAAARQKDLTTARTQFAVLRTEAAKLPDHGKPDAAPIGADPEPTLEEDAAYQHAVCTAALGDKVGAEKEYVAFMKGYPDSPLVQASIKRIARLHGGDIPKADEAVWRQAMDTAQAHDRKRERDASLCGPECLAELLRRRGETILPATLANEMQTSERGTSLEALAETAKRHGWAGAQGLALTSRGLQEQHLPVIALVSPGHYVLVDKTETNQVTVWDPDAEGIGKGAARIYPADRWQQLWRGGFTLALK